MSEYRVDSLACDGYFVFDGDIGASALAKRSSLSVAVHCFCRRDGFLSLSLSLCSCLQGMARQARYLLYYYTVVVVVLCTTQIYTYQLTYTTVCTADSINSSSIIVHK